MVYEKLAVQRNKGKLLYTFWDKKCLCYGQDWEHGFLQGLMSAKVIVLLMSRKVRCITHLSFCYTSLIHILIG